MFEISLILGASALLGSQPNLVRAIVGQVIDSILI
jgi:hypothetical protein